MDENQVDQWFTEMFKLLGDAPNVDKEFEYFLAELTDTVEEEFARLEPSGDDCLD